MAVYYLPNQYDEAKFKEGCRLLFELIMREAAKEKESEKQ